MAHLRHKESDRLLAVATELNKMGIAARETADGLIIPGGTPHGAAIDTYQDHRLAMSFAVAGLKVPGVVINDPGCVAKSFPDFWDYFDKLYQGRSVAATAQAGHLCHQNLVEEFSLVLRHPGPHHPYLPQPAGLSGSQSHRGPGDAW